MVYRAIGLMSGSSLDGLDIAYVEFLHSGGKWSYEIVEAECMPYSAEWVERLKNATHLNALEYQLLHTEYGHFLGHCVNQFIEKNQLHFKVALIASHGHTTFHLPEKKMTGQLGDGAAIAAVTQLPVVSDLRALDVALGGQGAPIVPIGEKLLFEEYSFFLNIGGIANVSYNSVPYLAFDICAANRVLNMLANEAGKEYDAGGALARTGTIVTALLQELDSLDYYRQPFPKSLANSFGVQIVYPLLKKYDEPITNLLRTYTEHIACKIGDALKSLQTTPAPSHLLVTGGGALNRFLIERIQEVVKDQNIDVIVPDEKLVQYKEAMIMALIGVLRWREEYNVISTVTGAQRNSVGGALWLGVEQ